MAGRKNKNIVDYFPHKCKHGKTMYIIENKYGNDGYSVWFKTLELLGESENHYFDCRNEENWEYLQAKTKLISTELNNIYDTFAKLNAIHRELWENKVIWSSNFIKNIEDAYKRRENKCMDFNNICEHLLIKCKHKYNAEGNIVGINTQSKVKESKVKESKGIDFEIFWNSYNKKVGKKSKIKNKWDKLSKEVQEKILDYIPKYIQSQPDKKYRKNPETFLNNESWNDEIITSKKEFNKFGHIVPENFKYEENGNNK